MKNFLRFLLMLLAFAPLTMQAQFTVTFGTGTSSTSSGGQAGSPMSGGTVFSYTQNIYTAAELTAAGVPAGATIIAIDFSNGTGESLVLHNCRTYMTHRSTTSFTSATDYTPYNQLTLVDSSDWVTTGSGWFTVNLHSPFEWNGTGNLLIAVSYGGASLGGSNIGYNYTTQTESRHWRRGCRLNNGPVDAVYASYPEYTSTSTPSGTAFTTLPATSTNRPNLRITYILSGCPSLTPNVANIGPYTADLNWINFQQSVSSWDIMYGVHGAFDTLSGGTTLTSITDTFYTLTGLTSATTYAVYMKPYCSSGTGIWSAPRIFTTTAACPTPTTPVVMSHTADEATISWLPGATETGWEVACVPHGAPVGSVTPDYVTGSPYTIMNLIDNTQYDVYVRADCGNGENSYWTSAATFTTDPYCTAPRNVTVSQVVGSSALVSWQSALVGALDYTVEYSESGQNVWNTSIVNGTSTMLSGLTPQTSYEVRVFSNCTLGNADTVYKSFTTGCLSGGDYTVGTGTLTTYELPINNYWEYSYTQQIFLASEMNGPRSISSVAFQYAYSSPSTVKNSVNIYMGHTTQSTFSSVSNYISSSNLTLVYSGNLNCQQGWNTFNLTTPFQYNGTDNLVLVVDDNSGDYNSDSHTFYAHDAGANRAVHYYQDGADISMSSPSSADYYDVTNYRSNVKFGGPCNSTATCIAPNVYISDVTDESITVAWAPGYTESSWNLEYRAGNGAWVSEGVVTGSSYIITNLTSNTDYTVRMQSNCGGGDVSDWVMASVHTACTDLTTLPYIDNLDSYTGATTTSVATSNLPDCWSNINEGTSSSYSGYPIIYNSSTYAASGTNALRFYTYTTAGTYDDQIAILPPVDVTTLPMNTLQVAFDVRALSTSYTFKLDVGIMTDPTDRSTFVTMQSLNITSTTYANYEVPFSQYLGTGKYIAFKASKPTSGYNYGYVDNIRVELIPSCPKPTNVTSNGVTTNSVTLGWTEVGTATSWEIEYGPAGFTLGNGTVEPASTNPYTISNLNASTTYDFYVRSDCGGGEYSNYSSVLTAATECDAVTQLPYIENFDSYGTGEGHFPNCWTKINTYSSDRPYVNSTHYAGVGSLYFYAGSASTYNMAVTLPFDASIPINTLQATFMHRAQYASDRLIVGVMSNPTDASTFVPVDTILPASSPTAWQEVEVVFSQYTGTGQYIAFRNDYTSTSAYNYIDNLSIDLIPSCPKPQSVHVTSATTNSIELGWTEVGTANAWVIEYGPVGFTPGNGTTENASTNPYTISGLTDSTQYDFYVKSDCGGGEYSNYSSVLTAATECDAVTQLPYIENFDSYGTGEGHFPNCWTKINTYSYDRPYVNSTHYAGVGSLYFYAGSATYNIAVVPQFDASIPVNTLQATFMYRAYSTTDYMIVGVMTNASDASTFVPVDTVYPASTASTWVEKEIVFSGYTGTGHYIAFYNGRPTTTCYSYIDNLSIDLIPACPKPQNLHVVDATVSSIELGWTEVGSATSWEIVYGAPGFDPNGASATSVTATTNPYTITGLNGSTTYEFYVRSLCGGTDISYWSTGQQASTTMTPEPLPYTADFTTNDAWVLNNGSCTNYWMKGTVGGTAALFVTDNGSTPNYTITSTSVVAAQKLFTVGTSDTITITFDVQVQGESSFDYMKLFLAPASQQFPASTSAPVTGEYGYNTYSTNAYNFYAHNYGGESSSYPHILNQVSGTIHVVAKMPNPNTNPNANSTALMVFAWKNDPSVGTQPPATITNLTVTASSVGPVTCAAPTGVTASNVTQTSATVTWTAGGTETAWELQYKTAAASNWSNSINVTGTPSHNLTGLTAGTQYQVRVRAVCSASETSNWSTTASFTTTQASVTPPTVTTDNATNITATSATLNGTVTAGSETITAQGFEWKVTTGGTYTQVNATGTTMSYNLTGLTANTGYTFRAFATTASGTTYGAEKTFTATAETCAAPTNVTASNITNNSADISWTQQGDVTNWDVNYRVAGVTSWYSATTSTNPYTLTGLSENTSYEVQVIAHCTNGVTSDPSAIITLTTVGINDYELSNVVVYPNPTTGMIQIQNSESRIENVEVYDAYGKMLNVVNVNDNTTAVDLSNYAAGTYFVKIVTENGVVTKRVVKQ